MGVRLLLAFLYAWYLYNIGFIGPRFTIGVFVAAILLTVADYQIETKR